MTLYKTFNTGRVGTRSHTKWPKRIGAWVTIEGPLKECENGIHVANGESQLLACLATEVYEVEVRGDSIESGTKSCHRSVRLVRRVDKLNERTLRLFAADCADRALSLVGDPDPRSVEAVRVARLFARGECSAQDLACAARAARDASSARYASAAMEASTARAAWEARAAWSAWSARTAMEVRAAMEASTARAVEREWQANRLRQYINGDGLEASEANQ